MPFRKRLGYWLSERKCKKLSLSDIEESLRKRDIEPIKINLEQSLNSQGPFDGVLHKLTDIIVQADYGSKDAQIIMENFEEYFRENPNLVVIDSIDCIRTLIDRLKTYTIIQNSNLRHEETVFVPPFVALESNKEEENIRLLKLSKVTFPLVCKPIVAHGSSSAHQMTLVFNEKGLSECVFPCLIQSFINHNAILYKLFAFGDQYHLVERPSIRNLTSSEDIKPIHFDGGEISKQCSCSQLTFQEERDIVPGDRHKPSDVVLSRIVTEIHQAMGLGLFGVDVVVESTTGRHAIIDINAFPGYDGVSNFSEVLATYVKQELDSWDVEGSSNQVKVLNRNQSIEPNGTIPSTRLINMKRPL